jgi:hypothetical protein
MTIAPNGARTAASYQRLISPPRPTTWLSLQGVTESQDPEAMRKIVASWLHPARVDMVTPPDRAVYEGYAFAQRAHEFRLLVETDLEFDMVPTAATVNPVFLLNNWPSDDVRIAWGHRDLSADDLVVQREDDNLIVWVQREVTYPIRLRLTPA